VAIKYRNPLASTTLHRGFSQPGAAGPVTQALARPARPVRPQPAGAPSFQEQAGRDVQAVYSPVIQAIADQLTRYARAGQGAVSGYANEAARRLGAFEPQVAGIYGQAQQQQAAANAALQQGLAGQGTQLSQELAGKLGAIGAQNAGQVVGGVQQTARGAGNAGLAMGSAELGNLIARGASARTYAAGLPALARLEGLRGVRQIGLQTSADIADQTGRLRAQIPGAVIERGDQLQALKRQAAEDAYRRWTDTLARRFQQRQFDYGVRQDTLDRRFAQQQFDYGKTRDEVTDEGDAADRRFEQMLARNAGLLDKREVVAGITGFDPVTGKPTPEMVRATQPDPGEVVTRKDGSIMRVNPDGTAVQVAPPTATPRGGVPAGVYATNKRMALEATRIFYEGKGDEYGNVTVPPIEYQAALKKLTSGFSLTMGDASAIADAYWQKGESDRPWLSHKEREALRSLGIPDRVVKDAMRDEERANRLINTAVAKAVANRDALRGMPRPRAEAALRLLAASSSDMAAEATRIFYEGKEDERGNVTVRPIEYQAALKKLTSGFGLTMGDAIAIADTYWQKGESDRPWLSPKEREALRRLGIPDRVVKDAMWDEDAANRLIKTADNIIESLQSGGRR